MLPLRLLTRRSVLPLVIQTLVAAAISVAVNCVLFPPPERPYGFEVTLDSSVSGRVQVFYNRGLGFGEAESAFQDIAAGENRLRLPLPSGKISVLRLDPLTTEGRISFGPVRITGPGGLTVRELPATLFEPNEQIEDLENVDGVRHMRVTPGANDPQLIAYFNPRISLSFGVLQYLLSSPHTLLASFGGSLVLIVGLTSAWTARARWSPAIIAAARRSPRLTLTCCGLFAAIVSSYPVVFLGKSFVSPNGGTVLLYDRIPMVPGYSDTRPENVRGADVGAMMWAHLPYTAVQSRAWYAEQTIPLWNRYNSCGVTLLGQGQSMIGEPINTIVMLLGAKTWAFDVKYVACKALFACGVGWCVWLLTGDLAASVIITFGSAFIAFFNFRVNHPAIFSMSYSPWILVAWFRFLHPVHLHPPWKTCALWFAVNWMMLTSGTVKEAYSLMLCLNLTGALAVGLSSHTIGTKLRICGGMAATGVAFILAAAPVWWTFLDALTSAQTMYDAPVALQAGRAWLIGLFDDLFYLELDPARRVFLPAANFLILLGCLWAVAQLHRLVRHGPAVALLAGLLLAVSIAFAWMPAEWLVTVPFVRNIQHVHNHFSCVAVVHAAVLAGWGFSAARQPLLSHQLLRFGGLIGGLIALLFFAYFSSNPTPWTNGLGFAGWRELLSHHAFFYSQVSLLLLALAALTLVAAAYLRHRALTAPLVCVALAAVVVLLGRHGQHVPVKHADSYLRTPAVRVDVARTSAAVEFLQRSTTAEPARVIGTGHNLKTGFISIHGLESINGPDAIFNPQYRALLEAAQMIPPRDWQVLLPPQDLATWRPVLDFLNVRFVGTARGTVLASDHYRHVASLDLDLYESQATWPRAFFTDHLDFYDSVSDLVALLRDSRTSRPFAAVQARDPATPQPTTTLAPKASVVPAKDYRLSSNTTEFTIAAPKPGYVVLHETWLADDFRATIDGHPVSYFRVNHAFKGIAIPAAGEHRIAFTYWPRHFTATLILSAIGMTGFLGGLLWARRSSPAQRHRPIGGSSPSGAPIVPSPRAIDG